MPAQLTAPPRSPLHGDMPRPPRMMAESARRGNRKRAWPRWTRPATKFLKVFLPAALVAGGGWLMWSHGVVGEAYTAVDDFVVDMTGASGFVVADVLVDGRHETEKDAVISALGVQRGEPIFSIDLAEARAALEQLPWVESASIERRLPDLLYVRLHEREPLAIWQHDRQFTVIDREGRPLADAADLARHGNKRIETLPQIVGPEAPEHVGDLLDELKDVPDIRKRISAASWIGNRRWDLKLDNGLVVKLPEGEIHEALHRLSRIQAQEHLFERDVVVVDMRQADRLVVQTSPSVNAPATDDGKKKSGKKI